MGQSGEMDHLILMRANQILKAKTLLLSLLPPCKLGAYFVGNKVGDRHDFKHRGVERYIRFAFLIFHHYPPNGPLTNNGGGLSVCTQASTEQDAGSAVQQML